MATDSAALRARPARQISLAAAVAAVPRWTMLLAVAVVARVLTFGNPLVHVDEEFYLVTAQRMIEGAVPYVDIWDRKPIGLFLIYLPAGLFDLPAAVWVYQIMALASVVATALIVWRLAERAGWMRGAFAAPLFYIFMLNFADGQGGQAPVFYNLFTAAAVWLILPRPDDVPGDRARMGRAALAFLLIGLGLQIKYSMVFEGMFLGLWLMWREHRLGARNAAVIGFGAVLAAIALMPTALAWGVFAALGHGDAWLYANFASILARQSDPAWVLIRSLLKIGLILGPLLICCGMSRHLPVGDPAERPVRNLYFGWLIASVAGLLLFGGYFNHYALPVMLPMAVCAVGFLGEHRIGRKLMWPLLVICFAGGFYVTLSARQVRGDGEQLEALAEAVGRGPECIYVYSGSSMLYGATRRCALSPWLFPSHISRERENGALGVDQLAELDRIFARRPEFVVMRPQFEGERLVVRASAMRHLARDGYHLKGRWPLGNLMIDVYERQATPASLGGAVPLRRAASSPS